MQHGAETKVLVNVLTGKVKVISTNGQMTYNFCLSKSFCDRLKGSLSLLKIIERLKVRRNTISDANRQVIELKINAAINSN